PPDWLACRTCSNACERQPQSWRWGGQAYAAPSVEEPLARGQAFGDSGFSRAASWCPARAAGEARPTPDEGSGDHPILLSAGGRAGTAWSGGEMPPAPAAAAPSWDRRPGSRPAAPG